MHLFGLSFILFLFKLPYGPSILPVKHEKQRIQLAPTTPKHRFHIL